MKLNVKKTKNMVFNRSPNQFVTKLEVNSEEIERDSASWNSNN